MTKKTKQTPLTSKISAWPRQILLQNVGNFVLFHPKWPSLSLVSQISHKSPLSIERRTPAHYKQADSWNQCENSFLNCHKKQTIHRSRIKITLLASAEFFRYDLYFSNSNRLLETYESLLNLKVKRTQSDGTFVSWLLSFLHRQLSPIATNHRYIHIDATFRLVRHVNTTAILGRDFWQHLVTVRAPTQSYRVLYSGSHV